MATISLGIDGSLATSGGAVVERALNQIREQALRTAQTLQRLETTTAFRSGPGNQRVAALNAERQALRALEQDRERAAREQSRRDSARLRNLQRAQRAQRAAERAFSQTGPGGRELARQARLERDLAAAVQAGTLTQARANTIRRQAAVVAATQAQSTRALRNSVLGLDGNFSQLSRTLSVLTFGPLSGAGARLIALNAAVTQGGLGLAVFAVGVAGASLALGGLVKVGTEAETATLRLEGVLRATGDSAGVTLRDIELLSRSIGIGTLASVQDVREASAAVLTFRSISGDAFERTLRIAQDLAELGFGSIQDSATRLAKALEDPITNLTSLRRVGVTVSQSQQDLIRDLFEAGRVAEAQAVLFELLEQQVGGTGGAAAGGLAGAFDTFTEKLQLYVIEAAEAAGVTERLTELFNRLNDNLPTDEGGIGVFGGVQLFEAAERVQAAQRDADNARRNFGGLLGRAAVLLAERKEAEALLEIDKLRSELEDELTRKAEAKLKADERAAEFAEETAKKNIAALDAELSKVEEITQRRNRALAQIETAEDLGTITPLGAQARRAAVNSRAEEELAALQQADGVRELIDKLREELEVSRLDSVERAGRVALRNAEAQAAERNIALTTDEANAVRFPRRAERARESAAPCGEGCAAGRGARAQEFAARTGPRNTSALSRIWP